MRKAIESISGATQIAVQVLLYPLLREWRRQWGSTEEERALQLLGDELVAEPQWTYDHAISINARRSDVWPWLLQLGQGRGGFYSYEGLENLAGCRIRNVMEVRPELQRLRVGDRIVLHGRSGFGPEVVRLEPERAGTTRLLERGRHFAGRGALERLGWGPLLMDPIGFVMSRKMLRSIKNLAEGSPR
jgi:hypothetical protein